MDYYNNISDNPLEKNQKNFSDFDQNINSQDMLKMMEKLNLGQNNEPFFNAFSNNNLGMNQMKGGQIEDEDLNKFNLNDALNQINQNQLNRFGNMNLSENLGNIMNNENQNKPKNK